MAKTFISSLQVTNCRKCGQKIWAFIRVKDQFEEIRKALCPICDSSSKWHPAR